MNYQEFKQAQRQTRLAGLKLTHIKRGKGDAVVLVHGIPDWSFVWKDTVEPLETHRSVYVFDMPGFGYSDKRDCFDRSVKAQAEFLRLYLEKMRLKKIDLVSHDTGGAVALIFSVQYPKRVRRLALINSVCYDNWPIDAMVALSNPRLKDSITPADFVERMWKEGIEPFIVTKQKRESSELKQTWIEPYANEEGKLSMIRNCSGLNTNHTMELAPHLKKIRTPVLLLWGREDSFELPYGHRLHADIKKSTLIEIPGAGHYALIDQAQTLNKHLAEFLS